jgi:hypothetical protein
MRVSPVIKGYKPGGFQKYRESVQDSDDLIVTPLYDEYLLRHPDVLANPEVFLKVMEEVTKPPRDRSRSFSASAAGYCLRRQELAFLGQPQNQPSDPRGVRIFNNGTFVHLRWQIGLLSAGIIDDIEYKVTAPRLRARASLDGLGKAQRGRYSGQDFVWEHKGRMSFAYAAQDRSGTPDPKTRKQLAMQMLLSGFDLGVVTNENKDNQEVSEFVIERNLEEVMEARRELEELNAAVDKQRLHPMLPECVKQNKSGEFFKCPFGGIGGACVNSGTWPRSTK